MIHIQARRLLVIAKILKDIRDILTSDGLTDGSGDSTDSDALATSVGAVVFLNSDSSGPLHGLG